MPDFSSINPLANVNLGSKLGTLGGILLVVFIVAIILGLIGALIYWYYIKKQYWIQIEVSRIIGGHPQRVAIYEAREIPFGMAGDKLWRVCPKGFNKFEIIKWLPVGKLQSAPRMFKYWIREDGEWINYRDTNIDEKSREMGVVFVQEDMKLQRLATERLLEQRLLNKTFWEKWGTTIMMLIVFLIVAVCMVIIFYQWSKLLDKMSPIIDTQARSTALLIKYCGADYLNATSGGTSGLIPV